MRYLAKYLRKKYGVINFNSFIVGIKSIYEEHNVQKQQTPKIFNKRMKKETFALKMIDCNLLIQLIQLLKNTYVDEDENYMKIMLKFNALFGISKKDIYDAVNYVEKIRIGIKKRIKF